MSIAYGIKINIFRRKRSEKRPVADVLAGDREDDAAGLKLARVR
jgi:hypothetical protein